MRSWQTRASSRSGRGGRGRRAVVTHPRLSPRGQPPYLLTNLSLGCLRLFLLTARQYSEHKTIYNNVSISIIYELLPKPESAGPVLDLRRAAGDRVDQNLLKPTTKK
jgi:hypothetical protein